MKKINQKKCFIIGQIFLALGLFSITFLPKIINTINYAFLNSLIKEYTYSQVEFLFLWICAICFALSPKYYKHQIATAVFAVGYYVLFIKLYPVIF